MTTLDLDLKSKVDSRIASTSNWIEVFPFGVAVGAEHVRPVMIFKDKAKKKVLPVCLSPIDAGIAVSQSAIENESSPHDLAWRILTKVGVKLEKCFFTEVKGHHQYVELRFSGHKDLAALEARADDAISFCLQGGCQFFTTTEYIEKSRVLEGQMMAAGVTRQKEVNPHPYLN
jgi:bifunctional DNase/RNase